MKTPALPPAPALNAELAALDRRAQTCVVRDGDRETVWRKFGSGPPLVLIHGGHGNWLHWVRNIEPLSATHTLWIPDLPGFGESDALPGDPHAADRLDRLVGTVIAALDRLVGVDATVSLAGFSFGGLVAAQVAARRGGTARLALLGPAGHGGTRRQRMEMMDWRKDDPHTMRSALRHNLLALMLHEQASIDETAMLVHELACRATRFRSKAISRQALLESALDAFDGPTLLIWGEHDVTASPIDVANRIAGPATHRDWCLVPGAGHWVQYERHRDINTLLARWFGSEPR